MNTQLAQLTDDVRKMIEETKKLRESSKQRFDEHFRRMNTNSLQNTIKVLEC